MIAHYEIICDSTEALGKSDAKCMRYSDIDY